MLGAASHRPVPSGPAVPSGPMSRRRRVLSHCRSRPAPFWKAKQQQTFNQALPPPEYPSLGNQSRYTRLFLTTSLAGATNWSRAECRFMRKWATKSRMLTVEFDAAANIGASGAYRVSRRESQEELRNMCIRVNAAHLRKAEQLRHPEASGRVAFVLLRLFILPPGPAWPLSPSPVKTALPVSGDLGAKSDGRLFVLPFALSAARQSAMPRPPRVTFAPLW